MPSNQPWDLPKIMMDTLASFLKAQISGLTVLQEWPYANQKLSYPSLTITMNKPKRAPLQMKEFISKTDPDANKKIIVTEAVADWDDTFQLDLWCADKLSRSVISDQIIAAFNSQETNAPDGLSLPMVSHYGEFARFEIQDIMPADDEAAAERQERRQKITVLVNCREIRQRSYYAIRTVQTQLGVGTSDAQTADTENH